MSSKPWVSLMPNLYPLFLRRQKKSKVKMQITTSPPITPPTRAPTMVPIIVFCRAVDATGVGGTVEGNGGDRDDVGDEIGNDDVRDDEDKISSTL
jgi:hypothetical protein